MKTNAQWWPDTSQHSAPPSPPASSHLFGPLQLVVHRLFGNLHLDDLLPEELVLILSSAAFVLHALQLVMQTHRHIFGHLRSRGQTYEPLTDTHNTQFIHKYTPMQTCRYEKTYLTTFFSGFPIIFALFLVTYCIFISPATFVVYRTTFGCFWLNTWGWPWLV